MEEKKILTDEELDNVVGGKKVAGYVAVSKCLGIDENEDVLDWKIPYLPGQSLTKEKNVNALYFRNTGKGFVKSNKQ